MEDAIWLNMLPNLQEQCDLHQCLAIITNTGYLREHGSWQLTKQMV